MPDAKPITLIRIGPRGAVVTPTFPSLLLLRVSDAGRLQRWGLHRGRHPKPSTIPEVTADFIGMNEQRQPPQVGIWAIENYYGSTSRRPLSCASISARLSSSSPASAASITVKSSWASLRRVTVT